MKPEKKENNDFLNKLKTTRIPLSVSIILLVILGVSTHLITKAVVSGRINDAKGNESRGEYNIRRLSGYKFIRPLLSAKPVEESLLYADLKETISKIFLEYKDLGVISAGSVYMRDFDKSDWMSINALERFIPGSILKVPVLMTYLLMEEEKPGTLNKKVVYDKKYPTEIQQAIVSKAIELGRSYTYKELLEYMIVYSDNNANMLLNKDLDFNKLKKLFRDLNIKEPDENSAVYPMTARECSRFLEALFNATYLNLKNSEYAVDLLTRTQFRDGIIKGIPESNLIIAHKFGESGNNINHQLHETAILYIDNKPYLLTIMTRGNDNVELEKLAEVIQKVSHAVYTGLTKLN